MGSVKYFYSLKKTTKEQKEELISYVLNDEVFKMKNAIFSMTQDIVIIGVLIEGEQFTFFHNNFEYYEPTEESINTFLNQYDRIIADSLNNFYTPDDIWEIVEENKDKLNNHKKVESMSEGEKALLLADESIEVGTHYKFLDKYKPEFGEFYNDNLRFSVI